MIDSDRFNFYARRMPPSARLQVLAELNPDVIIALPAEEPLAFGQVETLVPDTVITLGSSGAITAVAARRMGLEVAIDGAVGADVAGQIVKDALERESIDIAGITTLDDVPTGITTVLQRPDGDRALLTSLGAMPRMSTQDLDWNRLSRAQHVHCSSVFLQTGLHEGLHDLFDRVRDRGATTSVDPGWASDGDWSAVLRLLPVISVLLPNESELRNLAPEATTVEDAARSLARRGPIVAVKRGERGALLAIGDDLWSVAVDPVDPVDTTGAGDNFNAGFLVAYLSGRSPQEALCFGAAAGSHAVLGSGGTGSVIDAEALESSAAHLMSRLTQIN